MNDQFNDMKHLINKEVILYLNANADNVVHLVGTIARIYTSANNDTWFVLDTADENEGQFHIPLRSVCFYIVRPPQTKTSTAESTHMPLPQGLPGLKGTQIKGPPKIGSFT